MTKNRIRKIASQCGYTAVYSGKKSGWYFTCHITGSTFFTHRSYVVNGTFHRNLWAFAGTGVSIMNYKF